MSDASRLVSQVQPANCPAYILCGGQSARFGTDKARVRINEQPHLLRLAAMLREHGHPVHFVSSHKDRYLDLGIESLVDSLPECGPISGLVAAAQHRASEQEVREASGWFLLVSCDQLCWHAKYFSELTERVKNGLLAITYRDQEIQPIPGLYHSSIAAAASRVLEDGRLSIKRLLESLDEAAESIDASDNPRNWCFNSESELRRLLDQLGLDLAN